MSKVAVMMSAARPDAPMSLHFGKAPWIMVADSKSGVPAFIKNEGLEGRGAVAIVTHLGCSDVVCTEIGHGAFGHLQSAGVRGWLAPANTTGLQALRMFDQLQLSPIEEVAKQREGHGCCCVSRTGAEASHCCRG